MVSSQNVGKKPLKCNEVEAQNFNRPFPSYNIVYVSLTECCVSFAVRCIYASVNDNSDPKLDLR